MTKTLIAMRETIRTGSTDLPDYVVAEILSARWHDANKRRDQPELHGYNVWLASIPYPGLDYEVNLMLVAHVDGSVHVVDTGACLVDGWFRAQV